MASKEPPAKKAKTETEKEVTHENPTVTEVVDKIKVCQAEIEKLNEKASEEILQIEQKYNKIRKPFFRERNELFKQLPKFWGTVLTHHPHISTIIEEEEKKCLMYTTDCIAEEFEDLKLGYLISFHFDENPYFENTVLTKTIYHATSGKSHARSESTPIRWKEGKNLIEKYSVKIARHGKMKRRRPPPTFFSWFLDNTNASSDEVAETIKDELWPSALQHYMSPGDDNGTVGDEGDSSEEDYEEVVDDSDEGSDVEEVEREGPSIFKEDSIAEAELQGTLSGDEHYDSYPEESGNELIELNDDDDEEKESSSEKQESEESEGEEKGDDKKS